jgi:hypothetical protein
LISHDDSGDHVFARACLIAVTDSDILPEWEFATVMGITRAEANALLDCPPVAPAVRAAMVQAMNNLLGYPHGRDDIVQGLGGRVAIGAALDRLRR